MTTSLDYQADLALDRGEEEHPAPYLLLWVGSPEMADAMAGWDPAQAMTSESPEALTFSDRSGVRYAFRSGDELLDFVDRLNRGGLPGSGTIVMTGGMVAGLSEAELAAFREKTGSPQLFGLGDVFSW